MNHDICNQVVSCQEACLMVMTFSISIPLLCPSINSLPTLMLTNDLSLGAVAEIEGNKVWQLVSKVKQQIKQIVNNRPVRKRLFPRLFR